MPNTFHVNKIRFIALLFGLVMVVLVSFAAPKNTFSSQNRHSNTATIIQVGAYRHQDEAKTNAENITAQIKHKVNVVAGTSQGKAIFRDQIGPLQGATEIRTIDNELQQHGIAEYKKQIHLANLANGVIATTSSTTPIPTMSKPKSRTPQDAPKTETLKTPPKVEIPGAKSKAETPKTTVIAQHTSEDYLPSLNESDDNSHHIKLANGAINTKPTVHHNKQYDVTTSPHKITKQFTPKAGVQGHLWNLQNADIRSVIAEISRETGKNFIIDPRVQGKISIVSSTPLSRSAVYQVFLSTLEVLGYSAVPAGKVTKIVPSIDARSQATPIASQYRPGRGAEVVVRVIPVRNVQALQLVPILRPLLPDWGSINAINDANSLVIAGTAANVTRIANIIHRVDSTNANGIDMISLHYASAEDIVNTIQQLQQAAREQGENQRVSIAAEPQSNTILLSGNKQDRLKMRVLISQLDTPSASGASGNTQVVYLHYRRSEDLVPILAGVAQSYYRGPVGTVIGTRSLIGNQYDSISGAQGGGDDGSASNPQLIQATTSMSHPAGTDSHMEAKVQTLQQGEHGKGHKPRVEIIAEPNTNAIIINAPPTLMRTLRGVVSKLDIRPSEVLIEALIAEVDRNHDFNLGIKWGSVTGKNATGISPIDFIPGFRQGIGIINGKGLHNLQGVLNALTTDKNSEILSTPSIMVLDNNQAQIVVGQEVSIQSSEYPNNAGGSTGATPFTTFDREKVALHLYVTPQIDQNGSLTLALDQGNDTLENPEERTTTPIVNISGIRTSVLVNSGDIIVLGGLIQNQYTHGNEHVPILGDIPGIGSLFTNYNKNKQKKMLMVFIRPIIIHNEAHGLQLTSGKYNYIRNAQLNWFRQQQYHYDPETNQFILPPWGKKVHLPQPFSGKFASKDGTSN